MKTQQTAAKIFKKTVFVYKNVKSQENFGTTVTGDMSQSLATSFIVAI